MTEVIGPGSTIGILGAGQLGRMLAISARQMGYRVAVFGGDRHSPCGQVSDQTWDADFEDQDQLEEFAAAVDVVTYEFENVPALTAAITSARKPLRPGVRLLETAQNRLREKTELSKLGLKTARFRFVHSPTELSQARHDFGGRVILKSNTDGYDGKGQWALSDSDDVKSIFENSKLESGLVEEHVELKYELSVIAGRWSNGHCEFFDPIVNHHANHILDVSVSGATLVTPKIAQQSREIARAILEHFDVVGVLCVELFLTADGKLLVNEIAPRPHNSGHLTIEACHCSQFELQLRTICNLPPVALQRRTPSAAMANLLGQHLPNNWTAEALQGLTIPESHLHLYGKQHRQTGRKMGHLTVTGCDADLTEKTVRRVRNHLASAAELETPPE
ncbi:MAG: 5-(carboxyamino)imidazole ribonucleotide synthase [Planctomycetaceae bacterium]